jgi:lipid-binding SYLF domain-containing protein
VLLILKVGWCKRNVAEVGHVLLFGLNATRRNERKELSGRGVQLGCSNESIDLFRGEVMKKLVVCFVVLLLSAPTMFAANDEHEADRVKDAGTVLKEILNIPDDIPKDLLDKAECVIILPSVKKGAFVVGGSYGRGVMVCRGGEHYKGRWGAPALYALEGVSVGFQLGGQATDFVLLVMNQKGAQSLLSSKVKLGADASAAAGPKGRTAEGATDIVMNAEILSYSRNKGLFAGVSLEGSTLRSDGGANENLYGKKLSAREIIREGKVGVPACARELVSLLNSKSPVNRSDPKSLE